MNDIVSDQVVLQRVRNRIIEVLDLFADDDCFLKAISNLEFWADWVSPESIQSFIPPVFTDDEVSEIRQVTLAWDHVHIESLQESLEWNSLSKSAKQALSVFMLRGLQPEDVKIA